MDYQGYEDYMRSVLGYQRVPNNIYTDTYRAENNYYDTSYMNTYATNIREDELNNMYPEIYKIVYPMVCKICNQNYRREITSELLDQMTEEIYSNVEQDTRGDTTQTRIPLKNGDVRNPNAKEPEVRTETRQRNFMLRDLIKILILRELLRRRPPSRPPMQQNRPPIPPGPYNRGYDYY